MTAQQHLDLIDKTINPDSHFMHVIEKPLQNVKAYYNANDTIIFNGDCISILKDFPDNSIDMIFADPPYFLSNNGFTCQGGKMVCVNKGKWDKSNGFENDIAFHFAWINECKRVLKPEGTIWVSGTYHSIYACGYVLQSSNFHILNDIAWYKPNASPNLSCRFFTASHETLIWARKSEKAKHTFNYDKMKNGDFPEDVLKKPNLQMRSVWSISTPKPYEKEYGKHPTQKPVNLLKRVVMASTNEGDIILDPFCGSGTTGVACKCLGNRFFIGIEIEENYCELTKKRLS
ncbi:MAG: site-specific DNA-methyltransferase [Spirochaetaceae bacterium]|jgi:site-specific DNA-methyltransferase (adenine-specific)|nr:site-specific DNA-methyltransferase [Spirochaetaceae bacterium]